MHKLQGFLAPFITTTAAFFAHAFGGWDAALSILFTFMGLDLLTGVILSFSRRSDKSPSGAFCSSTFFSGLTHKLLILFLVIVAHSLDTFMHTTVARTIVIGFYAANEALSIIENAAILGVPFPAGLLKSLQRFRDLQSGAAPWDELDDLSSDDELDLPF